MNDFRERVRAMRLAQKKYYAHNRLGATASPDRGDPDEKHRLLLAAKRAEAAIDAELACDSDGGPSLFDSEAAE